MVRALISSILVSSCCLAANALAPPPAGVRVSSGSCSSTSGIKIRVPQQLMQLDDQASCLRLAATVYESTRKDEDCESDDADKAMETISPLPPVIQQIADNQRDFQMNLGKAMDTLRKDMPEILKRAPDYSIYHDSISVIDPSGVQLTGLDSYKSSISFLQTFIRFWFQDRPSSAGLQYRMVYDFCRSSIRVSWHVTLVPKVGLWRRRPLHIDGISMYRLDQTSGKIIEHKFEKLVINNRPVAPPYGIFSLLQQENGLVPVGVGIPAGV